MDFQTYLSQVKSNLPDTKTITLGNCETTVAYEELFKWEWLATKLKIFSFVTYVPTVDKALLEEYSSDCLEYARKNKKGLPLGCQNGIVSNNVIVSESISDDAIAFAASRPAKHYCAFEMPVIFDLSKNALHFNEGGIIWGMVYNSFIKDYIRNKFSA